MKRLKKRPAKPVDLPPNAPEDIRLGPHLIPGTTMKVVGGEFVQMETKMPAGHIHGWTQCGRCMMHATRCECRAGLIHPSSVESCYIRGLMIQEGVEDARERMTYDDPRIVQRAFYWYKSPRPKSTSSAIVIDTEKPRKRRLKPPPTEPFPETEQRKPKSVKRLKRQRVVASGPKTPAVLRDPKDLERRVRRLKKASRG